jgi:hypothetical protein
MVIRPNISSRQALWGANIVLALACAATLALGLALPAESLSEPEETVATSRPAATSQSAPIGAFQDYAVIYARPLNAPLFDAPPATPAAPPPPPPWPAALIGTVNEPGFTYGIFRTADGHEKLAAVGETVDGAVVQSIGNNIAVVVFQGNALTCRAEKKP